MLYFTDIRTVFEKEENRNIEFLSKIYSNKVYLINIIEDLIKSNIPVDEIRGKKVLLKPNWVLQNLKSDDWMCLRTNENFVLATVEVLLRYSPKSILIGDAPIQDCDWEKMMDKSFLQEIDMLKDKYSIPILIKDFRRTTWIPSSNIVNTNQHSIDDYLIFDVGDKSMLEPLCGNKKNPFLIVNYAPDVLACSHKQGMHKYCITKDFFASDIVITIPKIKTHQKTGLTNSMKILVGINGDKEYLPHHRMGGTKDGGDCYPGHNTFRYISEKLFNIANRNRQTNWKYQCLIFMVKVFWKLSFPKNEHNLGAAWHGNDTCWRMVSDLNRIAVYGKKDGTISDIPQRILYSLCDGIIGGQGDGPLQPIPLPLGIVSFTNNSALMDVVIGSLFRLNLDKIPLLKNAKESISKVNYRILLNKKELNLESLSYYSLDVLMPPGWRYYDS